MRPRTGARSTPLLPPWRGAGYGRTAGEQERQEARAVLSEVRELRALGRVQLRTGELLQAQLASMNARVRGDARRVEIAEQRVSRCMQRLLKAALVLDRVLVERGDEEGRRRSCSTLPGDRVVSRAGVSLWHP